MINNSFSTLFEPKQLHDLLLPRNEIERLKEMISTQKIINMIFHGDTGTGKTSGAKVFIASATENVFVLHATSKKWRSELDELPDYASCGSFYPGPKIAFVDDADSLPKTAQKELCSIMD